MTTTSTTSEAIDLDRVMAFAQQVGGIITGGATTAMMALGDRLGLYAALAGAGPCSAGELAAATGTHERYVREWLAQQVAVGFVEHDAEAGTFGLPPEHAAVLATDDSLASMIGAAPLISGLYRRIDELAAAFRTGDGIPWSDQDPGLFEAVERFFRVSYRNSLLSEWIPALEGMHDKLTAGAEVADVGCGHGAALLLLAEAYPASRFVGYDAHGPSVETANARAAAAGLADRVRFEVHHAHDYPEGGFDLITFFDTLHDLGDPVGAAAHARDALAADGAVLLVEPRAGDDLATTVATAPFAAMGFAASTFLCTPNSLSQPVGLALGALSGETRLREVLHAAGFCTVRRVADNELNMVIEARD